MIYIVIYLDDLYRDLSDVCKLALGCVPASSRSGARPSGEARPRVYTISPRQKKTPFSLYTLYQVCMSLCHYPHTNLAQL